MPNLPIVERHLRRTQPTIRCELHDHADHAEDRVTDPIDEVGHGAYRTFGHRVECEAEQDRDEQDRQDVAPREPAEERIGDDVEQELEIRRLRLRGAEQLGHAARIEPRWIGVHPAPRRTTTLTITSPTNNAERARRLEAEQGEAAGLPDLALALHVRDADDDRAEDQRRDRHLDELDGPTAERLELGGDVEREQTEHDAERDRDDARGSTASCRTATTSCRRQAPAVRRRAAPAAQPSPCSLRRAARASASP